MRLRLPALAALGLACLSSAFVAGPAPASTTPPKARMFINGVPDTGQFLPDTVVICRVGPRVTRVSDYVESYFFSYAEDRPNSDSLGRVQFLNTLVNKDLLGLVAREINPPMRFEDRTALRENQQRVLSNLLYQRAVTDSAIVTEDDLIREYESYKYQVLIRHILFNDQVTADRVRLDLVRGRITWKQAYERYSISKGKDKGADGEVGWIPRAGMELGVSRLIFPLGPGGISEVFQQPSGFGFVQVMQKREYTPPSLDAVRSVLRDQLLNERIPIRTNAIRDLVRRQISMTYDTTTIAWAAAHFIEVRKTAKGAAASSEMSFDVSLPDFAPSDTGKVLARYRDGVFTLGQFFTRYSEIQPLLRPAVNTTDAFQTQVDGFVFEPYMAKVALERGLDKDPLAIQQIETKREQLLVDRVYQDSVMSHVSVTSKARHQYYDNHKPDFVTYARVRFASLWQHGRPAADSLAARLRAGERAEDILRADSLLGIQRGSLQERAENEHGVGQKLLFEELKPGQVAVEGPNKEGDFFVYQSLERIPGRQLSYEEAESLIDESLQNTESERLLNAFIDRHRKGYPIESHPELVMKIRLLDPGAQ